MFKRSTSRTVSTRHRAECGDSGERVGVFGEAGGFGRRKLRGDQPGDGAAHVERHGDVVVIGVDEGAFTRNARGEGGDQRASRVARLAGRLELVGVASQQDRATHHGRQIADQAQNLRLDNVADRWIFRTGEGAEEKLERASPEQRAPRGGPGVDGLLLPIKEDGFADRNLVARLEDVFGDAPAVDEGPGGAAEVLDAVAVGVEFHQTLNQAVAPGNAGCIEEDIGLRRAADAHLAGA